MMRRHQIGWHREGTPRPLGEGFLLCQKSILGLRLRRLLRRLFIMWIIVSSTVRR